MSILWETKEVLSWNNNPSVQPIPSLFIQALELCHKYQLQKIFYNKGLKENAQQFSDMIHYLSVTQPVETEKSNIVYYKVLDAIADQKDTLIHGLHSTFIDKRGLPYLLIDD